MTEAMLFERYRRGDEAALTRLLHELQPALLGYIRKKVQPDARAEELLQEALLRITRARWDYDASRPFRTWAFTIASNLVRNELRNRQRAPVTIAGDLSERGAYRALDLAPGQADPARDAFRSEMRTLISGAVEQMDDHHRIPFLLRWQDDLSYEEISAEIGVPVGTVKSRLNRARVVFRQLLALDVQDGEWDWDHAA